MPLEIVQNDITKMQVDAIVNAANSRLQRGGGVCGAIFAAAGADRLQAECDRIGHCGVGSAVITGGYDLPARYIIHAVGPVWQGGGHNEEKLLYSCYTTALNIALEHGLESIAFPLISSGIFGYPKDQALLVAVDAIGKFLLEHDMTVYLVIFDKAAYMLGDRFLKSIQSYIDDHYLNENEKQRDMRNDGIACRDKAPARDSGPVSDAGIGYLDHPGESFSQSLYRLIDKKGKTDVEVYRRANLDRKLFLKIRDNPDYKPDKNTVLALAIALELNLKETAGLLRRAGYALSPGKRLDLIVEYFIRQGNFNIFEINKALFAFEECQLGAPPG